MDPRRSAARLREVVAETVCPVCDGNSVTTSWNCHTFDYGSSESAVELSVDVPVRRCHVCEFEFLDATAERLKHEAVCKHLGVLTPVDIRRIRESHRMSRTQFAQVTGLGEASLNRWENGLNIQNHANDRYLRLLKLPGIIRWLQELAEQQARSHFHLDMTVRRFRVLKVDDMVLNDQQSFRLHIAA